MRLSFFLLLFVFSLGLLSQEKSNEYDYLRSSSWNWNQGFRYGFSFGTNRLSNYPRTKNILNDRREVNPINFQFSITTRYALTTKLSVEARLGVIMNELEANRKRSGSNPNFFFGTRVGYTQEDTFSYRSTLLEIPLIVKFRPFIESTFFFDLGINAVLPLTIRGTYNAAYSSSSSINPIRRATGAMMGGSSVRYHLGVGFYVSKNLFISANWSRFRINDQLPNSSTPLTDFKVNQFRLESGWYF